MNSTEPKIRFYNMDGKEISESQLKSKYDLDIKEIKTSKDFNKALKIVINKDIKALSFKLANIIKEISKRLVIINMEFQNKLDDNIENIDSIINTIEEIVSNLIIKKNNIKVGFFSSDKKGKRNQIKVLDDGVSYLEKRLNDIISIKDEYNKLINRDKAIVGLDFEEDVLSEDTITDPLERTINFYMTKEN